MIKSLCKSLINKPITITMTINNISIQISNCNAFGDNFEELLYIVLQEKLSSFIKGKPQKSPDFYYNDIEYELKTFTKFPCFDIAEPNCYIDELLQKNGVKRKLFNKNYLIFEYEVKDNIYYIKNFWHKKIWDLFGYNGKYPLTCQNKRNGFQKFRPCTSSKWKNKTADQFIKHLIQFIKECPIIIDKTSKINNINLQWIKLQKQREV